MDFVEIAKEVIEIESRGLDEVAARLNDSFNRAVELITNSSGRVIVCGMGKSGIIGKKIAATFASTGTPSYFMHPGEAFHGDLGMVVPEDVFVGISYSGETEELIRLLPFLKRNCNRLISITGEVSSTLAKASDAHLDVRIEVEACPLQLAPTTSTTSTLVMGDALAVALMKQAEFRDCDFAKFHPGGALGRRLISTVADEMISLESLPIVKHDDNVLRVLSCMNDYGYGICLVNHGSNEYGIITDGDLRRAFSRPGKDFMLSAALELATLSPFSVDARTGLVEAWAIMEERKITTLLVMDNNDFCGVFRR